MYRMSRLNNGLIIATAEMPHMASVSVGIWVNIGSRYEPASLNGASHFIEHMLFKGTSKRSAKEISESVESVGGYVNAFTAEETTCFHARAGHEHFETILDVLMDMYLNSVFAPDEIQKERRVINEEIAMYMDEPQHHVQELLNATLWPNQALGRPITGTRRTLDAISRKDLIGYLRSHYVSGNTLVVAAGRLGHGSALRAIGRYLEKIKSGPRAALVPCENSQSQPRVKLFTKKSEQTQLALGIRTCSRHDERRFALRLLNTLIGENMSSRLFQLLREDRGLAYSIYSSSTFFQDTGDLVISAGLETDNVYKALKLVTREMIQITRTAPSTSELRRACEYVIGQMDLALESAESQMNWLGEQILGYGRIFEPKEIKRRLRGVTPAQIRSVARDFFRCDRINMALVSPLRSEKGLHEAIRLN
jgi:predicted Zn-dependent peptidase